MDRLVQSHAQEVHVDGVAAHGVSLGLLQHHRGRLRPVDAEVEDRSGGGEGDAQLARVDVEPKRLLLPAVEHAGDAA